jgi:glutathione synthase/RimK-type ligase-like ATP-grasp enzyme
MKIGISKNGDIFTDMWIDYCKLNKIDHKVVDCYSNDIIEQLDDCDALMWHHKHTDSRDILFAKQLLYTMEQSGKVAFPDFNSNWHFDDKVGQKYLLEAFKYPLVPSYVFYSKKQALQWVENTSFPKVFKLRGGSGASNVKLVRTKQQAKQIVTTAFDKGFSQYNAIGNLKERYRRYKNGKGELFNLVKGVARIVYPTKHAKVAGRESGYVYFQDFIPDNDSDIRVIVIDNKAYGMKRFTRENDFRASGSKNFSYDPIDPEILKIAFKVAHGLKLQSVAFDFVYLNGAPLIIEISYGFGTSGSSKCKGYWDEDLKWHEGPFNPMGWMVDVVSRSIQNKKAIHG